MQGNVSRMRSASVARDQHGHVELAGLDVGQAQKEESSIAVVGLTAEAFRERFASVITMNGRLAPTHGLRHPQRQLRVLSKACGPHVCRLRDGNLHLVD